MSGDQNLRQMVSVIRDGKLGQQRVNKDENTTHTHAVSAAINKQRDYLPQQSQCGKRMEGMIKSL